LSVCPVSKKFLRDHTSLVQGIIGTEAGSTERVFVGLRVDLFEGIVAEDSITSPITAQIKYHPTFAFRFCFPDKVAHGVLKALNIR
jgi:hypothetical protein